MKVKKQASAARPKSIKLKAPSPEVAVTISHQPHGEDVAVRRKSKALTCGKAVAHRRTRGREGTTCGVAAAAKRDHVKGISPTNRGTRTRQLRRRPCRITHRSSRPSWLGLDWRSSSAP